MSSGEVVLFTTSSLDIPSAHLYRKSTNSQGTQRQFFGKYICSEDDWRSRIFGAFIVKVLACLPLLGFSNISWYNCPFLTDFQFPLKR